jgi:Tfp pilus assembly protein PilF
LRVPVTFGEGTTRRLESALRSYRTFLALAFLALAIFAVGCGSSSPNPSSSADSLVARGLTAESTGHPQQAIKDFIAATVTDHKDASAYYQLGVIYQRLQKMTQAADAYKKALKIEPRHKAAMFHLAVLDTLSYPQAAQNLYVELLQLSPNDAHVHFNLGLLLIAEHQPAPGQAELKKAVSIDPALAKQLPSGITP